MSSSALVTMEEVARAACVSIATVSRVLNDSGAVAPATRLRVEQVIAELGYIPNGNARELRRGRTRTIGYLVNDLTEPYFAAVFRTLNHELRSRGWIVIAFDTEGDPEREAEALDVLMRSRISGLSVTTPGGLPEPWAARLRQQRIPIVYFDDRPIDRTQSSVTLDDRGGAATLTRHLLELGHRRIGLVSGTLNGSSGIDRRDGYIDALHDAGISSDPELIRGFGWGLDVGRQATRELLHLPDRPTAIITLDTRATVGAHAEIRAAGLTIPDDVSLASFSDAPYLHYLEPPVTALVGAEEATARAIATLLLEPDTTAAAIRVPLDLGQRGSTAPLQAK